MTRRILALLGLAVAGLAIPVATGWGALVLSYLAPGSGTLRTALAWVFVALGLVTVAALAVRRARRPAAVGFAVAFVLVLAVWSRATPSNDRDWQPEVAVLPYATIDGDLVTVHNIRNFDYRTETDFTPAYYDRTFDLRRLDRIDLVAVYWMGPAIAHLFLSFGFGDEHLPLSIEVRKRRSQPYSTVAGFFRQYELYYVAADERDVIRVRTNYRKSPPEQVCLFRAVGPIDIGRRIFLDYIRDVNDLREHPRFYNTLTTNCTTMILAHAAVNPGHVPLSWKILLSGYAPEYVYDMGRFDRSLPFAELKRRGHINSVAHRPLARGEPRRRESERVPGGGPKAGAQCVRAWQGAGANRRIMGGKERSERSRQLVGRGTLLGAVARSCAACVASAAPPARVAKG